MRILFMTLPGLGHFFPVVPTAWAARAAGHEVLIAAAGAAVEASGRAGLPAVDVAPGSAMAATVRSLASPDQRDMIMNPFTEEALPHAVRFLSQASDVLVDGSVELARRWRPDLVVQTPLQGTGALVAALQGVPWVDHRMGVANVGRLTDMVIKAMASARGRHGLTNQLKPPAGTVDFRPPSMADPDETRGWHTRFIPFNGGGRLPDWLIEPPAGRPRLCVTLGSVVPTLIGVERLAGLMAAAADLDADVVLALGDTDLSALGPLPSNVRRVGWVPLSVLLDTCAGIVHHGGAGTTMNALAAGLPQLVLPHAADQHRGAASVAQRGVGLAHDPVRLDATAAGEALQRLLVDASLRRAAQEVREEIAGLPPPAALVDRLVALVG